jgi:hypothetical protein
MPEQQPNAVLSRTRSDVVRFDVRLDAAGAAGLNRTGERASDTFLGAVARLHREPARTAVPNDRRRTSNGDLGTPGAVASAQHRCGD